MKAFGSYHPAVLMFYFVSVLLIAMFVSNPVLQSIALLGGSLFSGMLLKRREILSNIGFYVPLFFMIAVTNPLFSHNGVTPLFFMNGNPITLEACIYGIFIAVMLIGVMLWCRCYSEIMSSDKFLYLFGKVIPKLSLVLSMTLRFIPQFKRQMQKVSKAQKAMGLYSSKSIVDKMKSTIRVFMALIAWSLENSMETSAVMRARGYGLRGRTSFSLFRFRTNDGVLLSVCVLFLGVTLIGIFTGETIFYYYPRISELKVSCSVILIYSAYACLSLLPFFIEVKGAFQWKYYISKI